MKKKIFALILAVSMAFTAGLPAFAAEKTGTPSSADSGIHVMWENTDIVTASLNFSGDRAECTSEIYAKSGTTKIVATGLLKRVDSNGTTTVKHWKVTAKGDALYFDKSYYVSSGYTYEFEIDAKVYRNGTVEYVSESDRDYCG
jgi:hypothetical protein